MSSILIKNIGTLVTGKLESPLRQADSIFIKDGAVQAIGKGLSQTADHTIDANGITAIPGLIDSHSHPSIGEYTPAQNSLSWITNYMHGVKKPGARPTGVYTSDGADWSTLVRLEPGEDSGLAPAEREQVLAGQPGVVGMSVEPGDVTVYVADGGGGGSSAVYAVTDSGSRWERVAVR